MSHIRSIWSILDRMTHYESFSVPTNKNLKRVISVWPIFRTRLTKSIPRSKISTASECNKCQTTFRKRLEHYYRTWIIRWYVLLWYIRKIWEHFSRFYNLTFSWVWLDLYIKGSTVKFQTHMKGLTLENTQIEKNG